ncbi:MAG: adenylyl-sulfate kinase [Actinomycetota bacterium]
MRPPFPGHREGVLLSGLYGTGKTSVAEEIAVRLEHQGIPFVANYLDAGDARARLDAGGGGATPDAVVDANRPLAEVATEVLGSLGWLDR